MNALPSLAEVEQRLKGLTPEAKAEIAKSLPDLKKCWRAQPGKQTEAFESLADELLYGGAAGGGKTDLLIGLASTAQERSVLFRRQSDDLDSLWDRLTTTTQNVRVSNNSVKKVMRLNDGRVIEGAHLDAPGSEKSHQGRARDFMGFDEGAQLDEFKVNFVMQWLRSTTPGQRVRAVIATNPPIPEYRNGILVDMGTGEWLKRWFAPWLDPTFARPAEQGELRWCYMVAEGDRLTTRWVDGPGCYDTATGQRLGDPDAYRGGDTEVVAKSRTFIRSLVDDNAYLKDSGYKQRLSATPEPLRSMLLYGDFTVKAEDNPFQVIPTQWVLAAQERWRNATTEQRRKPMLVLSADIAQGGVDTTVLSPLRAGNFFDELVTQPGSKTPTGKEVTALLLTTRENGALIVLDGGGGWAGSTRDLLDTHHDIIAEVFVPSRVSGEWTPDMLYKYANDRTRMWWSFRLALDPKSGEDIMLPPSARLLAQLTTPLWRPKGKEIIIESKDEIRVRIGSSTDEADATLQGWLYREQALLDHREEHRGEIARILYGDEYADDGLDRRGEPQPDYDPLANW